MPKPGKVGALDAIYQYLRNKTPQVGFFSTLDELIANAPFEEGNRQQWAEYLKPGRTFERKGVKFPLKKEEIDYANLHEFLNSKDFDNNVPITRAHLRSAMQVERPGFHLKVQQNYAHPRSIYPEEYQLGIESKHPFHTDAPEYGGGEWSFGDQRYEESATQSRELEPYRTHFGEQNLSHSRSTEHFLPTNEKVRLVEEIQSDRHQAAAKKLGHTETGAPIRRGYRTPEDRQEIDRLVSRRLDLTDEEDEALRELRKKPPPGAPFQDPADYGLLELRKQLLEAAKNDQDYLALVRGPDVSQRFSQEADEAAGTSHVYDKVYPSVLRKLAAQYGASVEEHLPIPSLVSKKDVRPDMMRELDVETPRGMVDMMLDMSDDPQEIHEHVEDFIGTLHSRLPAELQKDPSVQSMARRAIASSNKMKRFAHLYHNLETNDQRYQRAYQELVADVRNFYSFYERTMRGEDTGEIRTFPAMRLTPEIREKIKQTGVPIWSAAAMSLMAQPDEEEQGYAGGGKVKALDQFAQYIRNKLPQMGFFSTLDELIDQAPYEEATVQQWKDYLKPGRTFEREGVKFPLKKEELQYAGLDKFTDPTKKISKQALQQLLRGQRPDFRLKVSQTDQLPDERFPAEHEVVYSNPVAPDRRPPSVDMEPEYALWSFAPEGGKYEENATTSPSFDLFRTHFGNDVLSHSRTTEHELPPAPGDTNPRLVRLIEEIQSDRHQAAADKVGGEHGPFPGPEFYLTPDERREMGRLQSEMVDLTKFSERPNDPHWENHLTPEGLLLRVRNRNHANRIAELRDIGNARAIQSKGSRVGYRTPDEDEELDDLLELKDEHNGRISEYDRRRIRTLQMKPPDAPFKDPADYGGLEMRKQLLEAANQDADYLALVRGRDVKTRFGQGEEKGKGTSFVYDDVYTSALRKLARQYGTDVEDLTIPSIKVKKDTRPELLQSFGFETPTQWVDSMFEGDMGSPTINQTRDLIHTLEHGVPYSRAVSDQANRARTALRIFQTSESSTGLVEKAAEDLDRELKRLYEFWDQTHGSQAVHALDFPALKLTPETRSRIRKAGVPIWATAGATAAGAAMQDDEESQGYSAGGEVSRPWDFSDLDLGQEEAVTDLDPALVKKVTAEEPERESEERGRRESGSLGVLSNLMRGKYFGIGDEDWGSNLRAHVAAGFGKETYGIDPETGEMHFLGAPASEVFGLGPSELSEKLDRAKAGQPPRQHGRPGIIDETAQILPGRLTPEHLKDSSERLRLLEARVRGATGTKEPEGFAESTAEALGTMLGQVPMFPLKLEEKLAEYTPKAVRLLAKPITAGIEWFSPVVTPSHSAYLSGALFGGALDTGSKKAMEFLDEHPEVWNQIEGFYREHPAIGENVRRLHDLYQNYLGEPEE